MTEETKQVNATNKFNPAYISDPRLMCDKVLNDEILGGTITMPVYLQDSNGQLKVETEDNKGITLVPTICTIPFYMEGNFSFSLGNEWKPMVDASLFQSVSDMFNMGTYGLSNVPEAQISLISTEMQTASWKGSQQPTFRISTTFICTRRDYNPINIIKALSESCLPRRIDAAKSPSASAIKDGVAKVPENVSNWLSQFFDGNTASAIKSKGTEVAQSIRNAGLAAPLYFAPTYDKQTGEVSADQTCTLTLQIGRWFRAPKLIVKNINSIEFSKEVIAPPTDWEYNRDSTSLYKGIHNGTKPFQEYGFPLYAKCTIELQPITYITADEFLAYFIQVPQKAQII